MTNIIYQDELDNGLQLQVEDQSNRYFGDYHRLRLFVSCPVPVRAEYFAGDANPEQVAAEALQLLGTEVVYEKPLERMGVAGGELEAVRQQVLDDFLAINRDYLARGDFPAKFLALKLRERQQVNSRGFHY